MLLTKDSYEERVGFSGLPASVLIVFCLTTLLFVVLEFSCLSQLYEARNNRNVLRLSQYLEPVAVFLPWGLLVRGLMFLSRLPVSEALDAKVKSSCEYLTYAVFWAYMMIDYFL